MVLAHDARSYTKYDYQFVLSRGPSLAGICDDASRAPHPAAPPRLTFVADKEALVRRELEAAPVVPVVIVVACSTPHLFGVAGFPKLKFISHISHGLDVTLHGC